MASIWTIVTQYYMGDYISQNNTKYKTFNRTGFKN